MTATRPKAESNRAWRQAPMNIEAEQALLGAIFINNDVHDRVSSFLEAHHFYDPLHQHIYAATSKLIASGKQANPITLRTFFETAEPIDATTTVPVYLGKLAINATTIINARDYGRTIHDLYTRRRLIIIGEDLVNNAFDSSVDLPPKAQIEEAEMRLFSLVEHRERGHESDFAAAADEAMQSVQDAHRGKPPGLSIRLKDLDAKLGGLQQTDLLIVAGRPGMGKTAFATNIGRDLAAKGTAVAYYSLEMSRKRLATRIISERAEIPADRATRTTQSPAPCIHTVSAGTPTSGAVKSGRPRRPSAWRWRGQSRRSKTL
jgi:replicative DNA helicase